MDDLMDINTNNECIRTTDHEELNFSSQAVVFYRPIFVKFEISTVRNAYKMF